jgi:hypothetical protein
MAAVQKESSAIAATRSGVASLPRNIRAATSTV